LNVYHYLAILHDYNHHYDSSEYYYQLLIDGRRVSWSNYANMQHEVGKFGNAIENYSKNLNRQGFSLSEPYYYLPMMYIYSAQTKEAIALTHEKIVESGSTPGFGWYNIALARSYLYDGQLDSCDFFLNKASNFKELHIGTTLTQSQYEFTVNLLRIQYLEKKMALIKFCNSGWWYSLGDLYDFWALKAEKLMIEYALVNTMANNPERDRIVYELFCSETTVTFDESMYLLKDFCLPYFERMYNNFSNTDTRRRLNRYYRLFSAKFEHENGDEENARLACEQLLSETVIPGGGNEYEYDEKICDYKHERLYAFRLLETLTKCSEGRNNYDAYRDRCFEAYPQLMPFTGISTRMNISFSGLQEDEKITQVVKDIKNCNIELSNAANIPKAELQFNKKGDTYQVVITVTNKEGETIVENGELLFKQADGVGKELALRLFGKGGAVKFEPLF
jgi:hypothetical protein